MRPFDPALLRALPATRGPVALLAAIGILSGATAIGQAVVLALAVTRVVTGGPLVEVLAWLGGLLVLRGVLAGATELVARWAGLRVVGIVRLATLRRWLGRPEGQRPPTDVALARAGEGVSALEPYVARYLPALVTAAVVPALAVLALLWVDPWSALIVVLTLPLLPVFAALIGMHTREETEARWGAMALLAGHFLDVVRGLPTLVGYGRARAQVGVVREVGERHRRATVTTLRTAFMSTAALELLATISVAMVAVAVGLRLAHGHLDLLVGLTAILLAPEAYWPVRRVGQEFHAAADGAAVLEELAADGVLAHGGGGGTHPGTHPGADAGIALSAVSYAHPGRARTVLDLSLTAPAAPGLTALVGPSGAGKTTALELLAGLRLPDAGAVHAPRAHLATQRPVILPGTVRDNLLLVRDGTRADGRDERTGDAELVAALQRVGLWEQLAEREGLDTPLGDDGFGLSAGQRARLALARALLSDALLVLLDEPTANVAADSLPRLHQVVLDLAGERRVVVVTHDPTLTELADQVWRLDPAPLPSSRHRGEHAPPGEHPHPQDARGAAQSNQTVRSDGGGTTRGGARTQGEAGPDDGGTPAQAQAPLPGQVRPLPLPQGRAGLVTACLLGGAALGCGVALTATSGWLIVQASTMPVVLTLLVAIVGVRAFGLFRPVFRYAERVVSHDVALADLAERRADVFARLIPLTPARLGRRSRGEVLTAVVRDLDDVVDEQVRVTVPAWSAVIATVVGAAIAAWHLPTAGLVIAVGGLATLGLAAGGYLAERAAQASAVRARGEVQHRTTALVSRLLALQAVRGLDVGADRLLHPVRDAEDHQRGAEQRLITARALVLSACWVVVAAVTAAVALLTWGAHVAGELSGPYSALVALVPMALADTWVGAPEIAGARARARAAAERLGQVLRQSPAVAGAGDGAPTDLPPHLHLSGVGATWTPQDEPAARPTPRAELDLSPLDLDLPPGSRVALTGANGAGKSTALAVLARHLDPATGRYDVSGQDVLDLDLERTRSRIAVVEDEPHAFAGSVRANLTLAAPDATDAELVAALDAVDLGHWFDTLPEGLDTPLGGLSGGERARLSLARAVVSGRPVVLLDEPTAHLDDATAQRALAGLDASREADEGVFVLVSHRTDAVVPWAEAQVAIRA